MSAPPGVAPAWCRVRRRVWGGLAGWGMLATLLLTAGCDGGRVSDGRETMLQVGDAVPELRLNDQQGQALRLADLIGAAGLIVYFYPADFTPVCTREACTFRDQWPDLNALGVPVVGISPQDEQSHARFAAQHELPFPLLADPDKRAIAAFGVQGPLGFGVRRATFFVGVDGRVRARAVADIFLGDHKALIEQVLAGAR